MIRRAIDLALVAAILVGGVLAWQTNRERAGLRASADRLARSAGVLPVGDPDRVHLTALDTGEPLHFAWRVHWPANAWQEVRYQNGSSSGWNNEAREFIARVRFREGEHGGLEYYANFGSGSSNGSLGDPSLADFLRGRWEEVEVQQLGRGDVVALDRAEPAVLLRLTMPDTMAGEARDVLSAYLQEQFVPELFLMELGPQPPNP